MNMLYNRQIARKHCRNRWDGSRGRSGQCCRVLEYFFHACDYHFASLVQIQYVVRWGMVEQRITDRILGILDIK
jgi:hypothetical protein